MSMSIFLSHMDTAPAEYHVIALLSYLISIDPFIFNCFDVHRIWIWVSYVEFDPSAVLRGDAVVFALVHVCHASGLRGSSFMTLRVCESAYYKSIQNHAVLCSTIKSSAKNQTKDCPNILYTSPAICFLLHFCWDVCLFDSWHQNWCELQGGVAPLIMPLGYSFRGQ